jgi:hypothetical protein
MEINGTIVLQLPLATGTSKNGNTWKKQEFVLETKDQYPKKVCFTVWGEKIDQFALQPGEEVTLSFDLESREYNGRWYTEVKAWGIRKGRQETPAGGPVEPPPFIGVPPLSEPEEQLPF